MLGRDSQLKRTVFPSGKEWYAESSLSKENYRHDYMKTHITKKGEMAREHKVIQYYGVTIIMLIFLPFVFFHPK